MESAGDRPQKPRSALGGRFWLEEKLGEDASGELHRGIDLRSGTQTLVRIVRGEGSTRRERLLRETRRAAQVKHPGLAIVLGVGQTEEGDIFVAAETLMGDRLSDRLEIGERFDEWESAEIAVQIANAIAAAHDADVVHRLLRPSLIVLTYEGDETRVKVEGLGVPRAPIAEGEEDAELVYSAPEQRRGETVGRRADVYSIGAMVYAMLTGAAPGPDAAPVTGLLGDIVKRCLADDPKDRFVDTNALSAALKTTTATLPPRVPSKMPMAPSVPPSTVDIIAPRSAPLPVVDSAVSLPVESQGASSDHAIADAVAAFDPALSPSIIPLSDDGAPSATTTTAPPPSPSPGELAPASIRSASVRPPAAPPKRSPGRPLTPQPAWQAMLVDLSGRPLPRAAAAAMVVFVVALIASSVGVALVLAMLVGGGAFAVLTRAPRT